MGEGGGGEEKGSSLPFSLPSFPFPPETPDNRANFRHALFSLSLQDFLGGNCHPTSGYF